MAVAVAVAARGGAGPVCLCVTLVGGREVDGGARRCRTSSYSRTAVAASPILSAMLAADTRVLGLGREGARPG